MNTTTSGISIILGATLLGATLLSGCASAQDADLAECSAITGSVDAAGFWPCMQYRQGRRQAALQAYAGAIATQQLMHSYQPQPVQRVEIVR